MTHIRWTDPETSAVAATSDKEQRAALCHMILMLHRVHPGGLANFEVADMLGLDETCCYWKRVNELRAAGYLEWAPGPNGKPRKVFREQTGKWQQASRVTVKGLTQEWNTTR